MALFTTNYSEVNNNDFDVMPQGEYEVVIKGAQQRATKTSGREYIQIDFVIRNDLDGVEKLKETNGKFHNRIHWHDLWSRKDGSGYPVDQLQTILYACKIPEGQTIEDVNALDNILRGKPVKITLDIEENEYKGEVTKRNRVKPWNIKPSDYPDVQHQWKEDVKDDPFSSNGNDISDSSLPF